MLRISKLADYATVVLATLTETPSALMSATEIAERTRIGLPTVSKLLKELQRSGLVASVRGARGGYQLARPAGEINAAQILDAVEGPVALTECATHAGLCDLEPTCRIGGSWQRLSAGIRRALEDVTLEQLLAAQPRFATPDLAASLKPASKWQPLTRLPGA